MSAAKVKVLPECDPRGIALLHGMTGTVFALIYFGVVKLNTISFGMLWALAGGILSFSINVFTVVVPLFMAMRLASRCRRPRVQFWSGFWLVSAFGFSLFLFDLLDRRWGMVSALELFITAILISIVGGFVGFCFMIVAAAFRHFAYEIMEQDGTLCWTCGYRVGNPPISDRCSECGTVVSQVNNVQAPNRLRQFCKRHARTIATCTLTAVTATIAISLVSSRIRTNKLMAGVRGQTLAGNIVRIDRSSATPRWIGGDLANGVWRPVHDDPRKALVVLWRPHAATGQAVMQIQITGLWNGSGGAWGNPAISCDLNKEQAAWVLENDVPQSLVDAMLEAADKNNWVPMPNGGNVSCVDISPDGHFK